MVFFGDKGVVGVVGVVVEADKAFAFDNVVLVLNGEHIAFCHGVVFDSASI